MTSSTAPPDTRSAPPLTGAERVLLDSFLDFHRETLLWKCAGLTDDQLRARAVPTSTLSLLGLVRHRAEVDRIRAEIGAVPLDFEYTDPRGRTYSLRWVYLHMIEEYARHNGHADLLREAIDGATGE